jgi:hypothetical protein
MRFPMTGPIAALLAATLASASCASGPPQPPPASPAPEWDDASRRTADALEAVLASEAPAPPSELRVRLAFPDTADLDLYVSDPLDETVYYANTPVRSGGALDVDRRCEDAAPRVETVLFTAALPGRYRVGVDFQHRCGDGADVVPWAISIETHGERRLLRGLAEWNIFKSRVDEFEY